MEGTCMKDVATESAVDFLRALGVKSVQFEPLVGNHYRTQKSYRLRIETVEPTNQVAKAVTLLGNEKLFAEPKAPDNGVITGLVFEQDMRALRDNLLAELQPEYRLPAAVTATYERNPLRRLVGVLVTIEPGPGYDLNELVLTEFGIETDLAWARAAIVEQKLLVGLPVQEIGAWEPEEEIAQILQHFQILNVTGPLEIAEPDVVASLFPAFDRPDR
jgi:hypothetical protein